MIPQLWRGRVECVGCRVRRIQSPYPTVHISSWGWRVRPTPGAEGTALLLVGPEPTRRRLARSHPARMTRLKGITAHHAPHSECPKPCGFREAGKPGKSTLGPTFIRSRTDQTGCLFACAEQVTLLPGRPFTLTHIHEICTKFNEGYTLHRMPTMSMHTRIDRFGLTQAHLLRINIEDTSVE